MISDATLSYLRELEANNTKAWFEEHREVYETFRAEMTGVAGDLIALANEMDPAIGRANPDPSRCVTRTHRDMRFAVGKPPYKPEVFVMLNSVGDFQASASYYVHIEPGNLYAGGGVFRTERGVLDDLRERISKSPEKWREVVESPAMRKVFPEGLTSPDTLKVAPRGYSPEAPAIEYLRMTGFCANRSLTRKTVQGPEATKTILETFQTVKPMVDYLNKSAGGR